MSDLDDFKKTYFEECGELLDQLYAGLSGIAEARGDAETLNAVFRAVHSIKGGGGAFGFERLVSFAHAFEALLDMMRDGRVSATPAVAALLVRAADALSDLVDAARSGQEKPPGFEAELMAALQAAGGAAVAAKPRAETVRSESTGTVHYRIGFAPHADLFQRANDPLLLIRALKRLGAVTAEPDLTRLPDLAAIDPDLAYLAWTIRLATPAPRSAIEEVFEFAADDCDLSIEAEADADSTPQPAHADEAAAGKPASSTQPAAGRASHPEAAGEQPHSIRVDVEKVDRVVNLVGELVIS